MSLARSVAIIPARLGSTRLPGKVLLRRTGRYLVEHVYERVRSTPRLDRVIVAADDPRVCDAVRSFGGEAILTDPDLASGTDRVAAVVRGLPEEQDRILNVQGDEPEIDPEVLGRLLEALASDSVVMATPAVPFPGSSDPTDPNRVKVVCDARGDALYFSRAPIPSGGPYFLHLGVYAYRRDILLRLASMPSGRLERVEGLEQLRALEAGIAIRVVPAETAFAGIDTEADYQAFVERVGAAGSR